MLVIVAHPDDEFLWAGSFILKVHSFGIKPFIICLTNRDNLTRSREFYSACKSLGAEGAMLNYKDGGLEKLPIFDNFSKDIDEIIGRNFIGTEEIVLLLSHSPHGEEHGHRQHVETFFLASKFAHKNKIPFAFFSEKRCDDFDVLSDKMKIGDVFALKIRYRIIQNFIKRGLWRKWARHIHKVFSLKRIKYEISTETITSKKQTLFSLYPSQAETGKLEYDTLNSGVEYVYTENIKFIEDGIHT